MDSVQLVTQEQQLNGSLAAAVKRPDGAHFAMMLSLLYAGHRASDLGVYTAPSHDYQQHNTSAVSGVNLAASQSRAAQSGSMSAMHLLASLYQEIPNPVSDSSPTQSSPASNQEADGVLEQINAAKPFAR